MPVEVTESIIAFKFCGYEIAVTKLGFVIATGILIFEFVVYPGAFDTILIPINCIIVFAPIVVTG